MEEARTSALAHYLLAYYGTVARIDARKATPVSAVRLSPSVYRLGATRKLVVALAMPEYAPSRRMRRIHHLPSHHRILRPWGWQKLRIDFVL
jgi:hypothetical protein